MRHASDEISGRLRAMFRADDARAEQLREHCAATVRAGERATEELRTRWQLRAGAAAC
ncbi:hypothetical protein [Tamaricihabitans halophyticus]|uniref:hypothetical protein n=1 Tax=Tamaricihabitans halophyticus TaxID=1262583 RepID=UPI0014048DAA|nr:hypothetical protein [Tamaricihabitans halophyticus]